MAHERQDTATATAIPSRMCPHMRSLIFGVPVASEVQSGVVPVQLTSVLIPREGSILGDYQRGRTTESWRSGMSPHAKWAATNRAPGEEYVFRDELERIARYESGIKGDAYVPHSSGARTHSRVLSVSAPFVRRKSTTPRFFSIVAVPISPPAHRGNSSSLESSRHVHAAG